MVQGLTPMDTVFYFDQNPEYPKYPIGQNGLLWPERAVGDDLTLNVEF
jgi:hypothetical protein